MFNGAAVAVAVGAGVVLIPGVPLVPVLVLTQALNAFLLLPLLVLMTRIARDPMVMGRYRGSRAGVAVQALTIALLAVCVAILVALV